jgi:hypothetical protein
MHARPLLTGRWLARLEGGGPLKRHPALVPLSHDHHNELSEARRLRLASGSDVAEARRAAGEHYVDVFFTEVVGRFRVEEERLFPAYVRHAGTTPLLKRVLDEHRELRSLAEALRSELAAGDASGETLARLAELVEANVRGEERELFPEIERAVPDSELRSLELPESATR